MKTFLFMFLTSYAVSCDDSYYVIRMPEVLRSREFKVYWNVPTMQCKSKKILFEDLFEKYGIIQNTDDVYRGDKIAILYDPGNFPALIKNVSTGEIKYRNGGVPQEGNLMDHLQKFKKEMDISLPDKQFSGVGIIDFESWRPILRQNFGSLTPYKDVSFDIERKRHWWWKKQWVEEEARRRFDAAGRDFMQTTLSLAKKMRPKALWGYYGYPQCFNRAENSNPETCADDIPKENDKIPWLWQESTSLFPSVYTSDDVTGKRLAAFIRGRIKESERIRKNRAPVLPYWWLRYRDGGYFKEEDLETSFSTFYNSNTSGFIIWGSSTDVNTKGKCIKLKKYVTNVLGPAVAKYTKAMGRLYDMPDDSAQVLFKPEVVTEFDPEYQWIPPDNYTSNIEHIVEEEIKTKNETEPIADGNILVDMILNRIANFCLTNCGGIKDDKLEPLAVLTTKNPFVQTTAKTITERLPVETVINNDTFSDDSDTSIVTDIAFTTSMETESNDLTTTNIYEDDVDDFNSITSTSTENFSDVESTEKSTESSLRLDRNTLTNTEYTNQEIQSTSYNFRESTTITPKFDTNNINLVDFSLDDTRPPNLNSDITTAPNLSSDVTSAPTLSTDVTTASDLSSNYTSTPNLSSDISSAPNLSLGVTIEPNLRTGVTNAPDLSSNDNSLNKVTSSATSVANLSSNATNTASFSSAISTINFSDTSPSNVVITDTPTSRPEPIDWRSFYADLMIFSNMVNNEIEITTDTNDIETTAAVDMKDQVFVSVV